MLQQGGVVKQISKDCGSRLGPRCTTTAVETRWLMSVVVLLLMWALYRLPAWLPNTNPDQRDYFEPWLRHILQYGRLRSLEASFANYNPPFIYALSAASLLSPFASNLTVIKLNNIPFLLFTMAMFYLICRRGGSSIAHALTSAALVAVAPEIVENIWSWGQCDTIFSSFVVATVLLLVGHRPRLAMVCLGVALSFKLQALFVGPLILALILAGEIPFWTVSLIAAAYLLMLVPAVLAGRPATQIFNVYGAQYDLFHKLAFDVANPYQLLNPVLHGDHLLSLASRVGMVVCAAANVWFQLFLLRRRELLRSSTGIILIAALSYMLEIYTLPKMHERYYFPVNLLLLLLVALMPLRFAIPAALLQISSVLAYIPFLYNRPALTWLLAPCIVLTTLCGYLLFRQLNCMHLEVIAANKLVESTADTTLRMRSR